MSFTPTTPSHLTEIRDKLAQLETIFHRREQGTSTAALEAMIDESFWEVGASGRRYDRHCVIETVLHRHAKPVENHWQARDFACQEIAFNHYLLAYTLHQAARVTRRTTLWRRTPAGWKILFHQGTVVTE